MVYTSDCRANTIKPSISTELGYTDNLKFQDGRDDVFLRITPSLQVSAGPPSNNFTGQASAGWTQYFYNPDESDLETVNINLAYNRAFSPRFNINITNVTTSNYEVIQNAVDNPTAQAVEPGTRTDTNTTTARSQYRWGEFEEVTASYRFRWNQYDATDEVTQSNSHQVTLSGQSRVSSHWRAEASLSGARSFFEDSENTKSASLDVGAVRMIGPDREAFVRISGALTRVDTDDADIAGARDYDVYGVSIGADWAFSSVFKAGAALGLDYVYGNDTLNSAAGDIYPKLSLYANYTGQTWSLGAAFKSSLQDFNLEGQDSGLTFTTSGSLNFNWSFEQHWSFFARCAIIYSDPLQTSALTEESAENTTYSGAAGLTWQMTRYSDLTLTYKIDYRDSDTTASEQARKNEVTLMFTTYRDFLW